MPPNKKPSGLPTKQPSTSPKTPSQNNNDSKGGKSLTPPAPANPPMPDPPTENNECGEW